MKLKFKITYTNEYTAASFKGTALFIACSGLEAYKVYLYYDFIEDKIYELKNWFPILINGV